MRPDLSVTYLGLTLRSPLVPSASPRSELVSNIERMADAGAAAIVFHSLFAEQFEPGHHATGYFKIPPEVYCAHIAAARKRVTIPLIANLNVTGSGTWLDTALRLEDTGANAIELAFYHGPGASEEPATTIESQLTETVHRLCSRVQVPVAVKITPYYTNLFLLAQDLARAGASGLVLFSRLTLVDPGTRPGGNFLALPLSDAAEMKLPLHWIAILSRRVPLSFAASGGVQRAGDVVRLLMAGADVTMLCSVLLRRGIAYLAELERGLSDWLAEHGFSNLREIHRTHSFPPGDDPGAVERANYIRLLTHSEHAHPG